MDLAIALADQMPRRFDECVCGGGQEEVALQNLLRFAELLLRFLEVEVNVECIDKVCHWVAVFVALLPDHADEIFELFLVLVCVPCAASVGDNGGRKISKYPRAVGLDRVYERGREVEIG